MTDPKPQRRFCPSPAWLIYGLLVVEGLLWLSERFGWFWFNEKKGWTVLIGVASVGVVMLVMLGWFVVSLVFRWRFQFSIRSLLMLTIAVAIPCSWMAVEMKKAREQREAVEEIVKCGGTVFYDYHLNASGNLVLNARPPGPSWLLNVLGDDFSTNVVWVGCDLPPSDGIQVPDVELEHLEGWTQLQILALNGTQVTDADLVHVKRLPHLQLLHLGYTQVTNAGLEHLTGLPQLHELWLCNTHVTDAGIRHLSALTQLRNLDVRGTAITDDGVKKLQQALPNCKITR